MLEILSGFPDDVFAVCASGTLSAEDYRSVLEPALAAKLKTHKRLKMFYQLGPAFESMSAGAMWEDAKTGLANINAVERVAVVTDVPWVRHAVRMFVPLLPCPVRVFENAEAQTAREWLEKADMHTA